MGTITRQFDWSATSLGTPDQWPLSLRTTVGIVLHSAFPMFLFWGSDLLCFYNDAYRSSLGDNGKHPAVGKRGADVWPEIWEFIGPMIQQVITSGKPTFFKDQLVPIYRNGRLEDVYWTFSYSPAFGDDGRIDGVFVTCTETTDAVLNRRRLEESETKLRSIVAAVPAAMALFVGRDLIVELPSQNFIDIIDRGPDVTGISLRQLMPELESQSFFRILDEVYDTGKPYSVFGTQVNIVQQDGSVTHDYFNLIYTPLFTAQHEVYAILSIATNVTEAVLARQQIQEAEAALREAIELAELATWTLDIKTGTFRYSERFMNWLGFSNDTKTLDEAYNPLPDAYRQPVADAINAVIQPGASGIYENEHPVINRLTGRLRIIHAQARVHVDALGNPEKLVGTARDITQQRELQLALEQQVQERTEELAALNEELASANEELAATNEELTASNEEAISANDELLEANKQLSRSNSNLEKFAYVASHDLQEPLRKIQSFGDLLQTRYAGQLGDGVLHLERMQSAANRMSTLIRDLLAYSRIATQQETIEAVSLTDVLTTVLTDLDLRIQETEAAVTVDVLPTIQGDRSQLEQLFQNLLSNALKFRQPEVKPVIRVTGRLTFQKELPLSVNPARMARFYHCINVADNGIGFDEKYVDRIFQVFQRLTGRSQYAGTGIGLAICEKVVANHGGAITATSQPGRGATFSVYLPADTPTA